MRCLAAMACLSLTATGAVALDLEDLARDGFGVLQITNVDGEFNGCEHNKIIPLTNGLVFICSSYRYSYSYRSEVLIMKSVKTGEIKVMIGGSHYSGQLSRKN